MMNVLAICLVLTSMVTAGVWSPTPEKQNSRSEDVIVKEGHRVVVVKYEKDDGNTKVLISSQEAHEVSRKPSEVDDKGYLSGAKERLSTATKGAVEDAKEKIKEASSVLPNVGQGLSGSHPQENDQRQSARELVCDAFGKCKYIITSALGKTKEKVFEKAHGVSDKAYEVEEDAKEAMTEAVSKAKDTVKHKAKEAADKAGEVGERAKEAVSRKAGEVEEGAKETAGKVKQAVSQKAREVEEGAKETAGKAKRAAQNLERNVSAKMEMEKRKVAEKAKQAEEMAADAADTVKFGAHKLKEGVYDVISYVVPAGTMGMVQLLGVSTAYGMCVWVTFVSSYVLAGTLPRQQFAMVQSKIYPVYFKAMAYSVGVALVGHLLSQRKRLFSGMAEIFQGINLLVSVLMLLANLLYLEPQATKVMFERMKIEKEEGRGRDGYIAEPSRSRVVEPVADPAATPTGGATTATAAVATPEPERVAVKSKIIRLSEMLKKLNSYSSFLNVLTLMALSWHLIYLGQRLHTAC